MKLDSAKIRVPKNKKPDTKRKNIRSSAYTEDFKGEYFFISVEQLIPFESQARKVFDPESIESLAKSIGEHGIRQPLTIIKSESSDNKFEIISGERRYRAAKKIGLKTVPCIIIHDRNKAEEIALIENIQREDLHPVELFDAFDSFIKKGLCNTHSEIAEKVGMSRTAVVEIMNLAKLSVQERGEILKNNIRARDTLREILKKPESQRKQAISEALNFSQKKPISTVLTVKIKGKDVIFSHNLSNQSLENKSLIREKLQEFINMLD